jgi:hypothetical protein
MQPSKRAAAAPMGKSVEHVLLRLLTPAMLLFLFAHVASGMLGSSAPGDRPAGASSGQYLQSGSDTARAKRPGTAHIRRSRTQEPRAAATVKAGFWDAAVAYLVAVLHAEPPDGRAVMVPRRSDPPEVFAHLRTHNPRDPPRPAA